MMSIDTLLALEYRDEFKWRIDLFKKNGGRGKRYLARRLKRNLARIAGFDCDDHVACFSFPNCHLNPNGCVVAMGDDVECIGHRG